MSLCRKSNPPAADPLHLLSKVSIAAFVVAGACPSAHALANIGGGKLDLNTSLGVVYDSRILGKISGEADTYVTFHPSLFFGRDLGRVAIESSVGVDFLRYTDRSSDDTENLHATFRVNLPEAAGRTINASLSVSYDESQQLDQYVLQRLSSETFSFRTSASIATGQRTTVGANASFSSTDTDQFSKQDVLTARTFFRFSDFLGGTSLTTDYQYTATDSSSNQDDSVILDETAHSFSVQAQRPIIGSLIGSSSIGYRIYDRAGPTTSQWGDSGDGLTYSASIEGPFLPRTMFPRLESSARISYQSSETPGLNDSGEKTVTGALSVGWQARERTRLDVTISRDQELTTDDLSSVTTTYQIAATQKLFERWSGKASVGYNTQDYVNLVREDSLFFIDANLSYTFASGAWTASASIRQENRSADIAEREYDRTIASARLNAKF